MPAPTADRKKLLALVVAVVVAYFGFMYGIQRLDTIYFFAWSNERSGRPTLTGQWVGQLATGTGRPRGVFVELRRHIPKRRSKTCDRCGSIKGRALTCDERGREQSYELGGTPADRRATRIEVSARPAVDPPPQGLELNTLNGTWDGADALALSAGFFWRKGTAAVSSSDDPDTSVDPMLRMRRGTEADFRLACGRLVTR